MNRVAVVDDDYYVRLGVTTFLRDRAEIGAVTALDHPAALAFGDGWREVDVALVDAADDRRADDQFPGVAVVEEIRRRCDPGRPRVVVVTGHAYDEAVRRRMREAGADFLYDRRDVLDPQAMLAAVLRPGRAAGSSTPRQEGRTRDEERLGVSRLTRVNAAVAYALAEDLPGRLAERANPRGRAWERVRAEFGRVARIATVNADGLPPDREQDLPSLRQIERFLTWATRIKRRP
ncbi:response regulator [Nonomuraea deserti]|uniref:Response regulator n=1 Tax=Nonomuraea deserti TaxID=1848322 RepID=A0A4R4VQM4_9ACTN|nr:response regulator [Nonomuraea deserti]TDD07481.1 response regulator [Nonomuraea deserti]